jgi:flagellar basal body-associated protein FliL
VKLGKKTIVLLGLPLGLGLAAGVLVLVVLNPFGSAAPVAIPDPGPGQHGVMLPLDTKVVNLAPGGDFKYAKVGVTLELRPADAGFYALTADARTAAEDLIVKEYTDLLPLLDDAVGGVVGAKTSTDLLNQGGRATLKQELVDAVRKILDGGEAVAPAPSGDTSGASPAPAGPSSVLDLYFTDLVMQ